MANVLEFIIKESGGDAAGQVIKEMASGLTDLEKATAGTRSTIGGLDKDIKLLGTNVGSTADFLNGLGVSIPISPMQLFGSALREVGEQLQASLAETVAYAEQVRDLGRKIGATAEQSSMLIQAADDVKVSYESLTVALQTATRKGLDTSVEGLGKLADQYNGIQNPIERTKFLLDTFGRSGAEMGKLMEVGSQGITDLGEAAKATGLVMTDEAVQAARDYEIAMDGLNDSMEGLKVSIGQDLIPVVTDLVNVLNASIEVGQENGSVFQNLTDGQASTISVFGTLVEVFNRAAEAERGLVQETGFLANSMQDASPEILSVGQALGAEKDILLGIPPAVSEYITATDNAASSAGALADETDRAALAIIGLEQASVGAMVLQELNAAFESGLIPTFEEYSETATMVMRDMMGMSEAEIQMALNTRELKAAFEAGETKAYGFATSVEYVRRMLEIANGIRADVYLYTHEVTVGGGATGVWGKGGYQPPDAGGANGLDMVVPPGYSNDSFTVGVSSGEHVSVTPAGQAASGNIFNITQLPGESGEDLARRIARQIQRGEFD